LRVSKSWGNFNFHLRNNKRKTRLKKLGASKTKIGKKIVFEALIVHLLVIEKCHNTETFAIFH